MLPALSQPMLVRQFDLNIGVAKDINQLGCRELTHYITWNDQTTGGEVTLEGADDLGFAGKWSPLLKADGTPAIIAWSQANSQDRIVTPSGANVAVRHRISSPIQGGPGANVSTRLVGSV